MRIAIEGCAHGELEKIYEAIEHLQQKENTKIDLLICCGDFQATRNVEDLRCMAVPRKYQSMCSFYKYYAGEKVAPILTIFIGGNHEASNYLQELPYGGWVAPNIYYLGYAGIVNIAGVRIGGLSGIYKGHDYMKGHFEKPPYTEDTKRSVYHIRNLEVFRLKQVEEPMDIFLSHDWPRGIYRYGDTKQLLKRKPFFSSEIDSNTLGSKPCEELLQHLKPKFWFAAHMHVKFAAIFHHNKVCGEDTDKVTKFLALDKCLPRRQFLQIVDIADNTKRPIKLEYDLEWLTILRITNHLLSIKKGIQYMPGPGNNERWLFTPSAEEKIQVTKKFAGDFHVPHNFCRTTEPYDGNSSQQSNNGRQPVAQVNPQTVEFCNKLGVDDPLALLLMTSNSRLSGGEFYTPNDSQPSDFSLPSFLTPEKSGDLTRVSLSPESEEIFQSSPSPRPARLSMVLPSPQNSDTDEAPQESEFGSLPSLPVAKQLSLSLPSPKDSDGEDILTRTSDDRSSHSESCSQDSKIGADSEARDPVEVPENCQPRIKKFKRRNEALYASVDEDL